jgi:hypothetical protein
MPEPITIPVDVTYVDDEPLFEEKKGEPYVQEQSRHHNNFYYDPELIDSFLNEVNKADNKLEIATQLIKQMYEVGGRRWNHLETTDVAYEGMAMAILQLLSQHKGDRDDQENVVEELLNKIYGFHPSYFFGEERTLDENIRDVRGHKNQAKLEEYLRDYHVRNKTPRAKQWTVGLFTEAYYMPPGKELRYQYSVPGATSLTFQDLDYPELKEIFSVPSNLSGKIQVGDMMEVTAKTPKSSSANIYKGKLDGHEKAIYLPAWMFNKDNQSKEKNNQYSLRRTPKKWTKNKFRKGKHSIKKGVHRVRRKIGIGGGSQRRHRSKLTRGKYKTKKKHKTRKRIKSRRL